MMKTFRCVIAPQTAFGTPLRGDTLFGQVGWTLAERYGEDRLRELLDGYTAGRPFMVLSDAFPSGLLPRPAVPGYVWNTAADARKDFKRRVWLNPAVLTEPFSAWREKLVGGTFPEIFPQSHNAINPQTATTGGGDAYAPFTHTRYHYPDCADIYAVIDEGRLTADELRQILTDIGYWGYGADASSGLGKFTVKSIAIASIPTPPGGGNALFTLAPCAVNPGDFAPEKSFYKTFVRFGRHGNALALGTAPFKNPCLLLDTGAVLTPAGDLPPGGFVGRGLCGVSADPRTVQQGYAPAVAFNLELPEVANV